jgi:hypothetical protein
VSISELWHVFKSRPVTFVFREDSIAIINDGAAFFLNQAQGPEWKCLDSGCNGGAIVVSSSSRLDIMQNCSLERNG